MHLFLFLPSEAGSDTYLRSCYSHRRKVKRTQLLSILSKWALCSSKLSLIEGQSPDRIVYLSIGVHSTKNIVIVSAGSMP